MNVERLHVIAIAIRDDINKTNIENSLQQLIQNLQNQVNQPQNTNFQQQVSQLRNTIFQSLESAKSNDFSPTWKQVIEELGLKDILGIALKDRIESIFLRNQITPATALQELQGIHKQITSTKGPLDQMINAFQQFKIGIEKLEPGECEIGVLIPRSFVKNFLHGFAEELENLNKIFTPFEELTTGTREGFKIKTISSTDLSIFFSSHAITAAGIAAAIERIIEAYKKLSEIRLINKQLSDIGVPDDKSKGILDYSNEIVEGEIEKVSTELVDKYYKKDDERKHELKTAIKFSLRKIANRIDRGFNIEVKAEPFKESSEQTPKKQQEESKKAITEIQNKAKSLQFLKLDGEPILSLEEREPGKKRNP